MKLAMTLLVRNAEAILRENFEFHLAQGIDFFIVTDNCSTDNTAAIAREYVDRNLAELIDEPSDDYSQGQWVTRMARRAATEYGADWVINNDDDEFWHGRTQTLREIISRVPNCYEGLEVRRYNHPPIAQGGDRPFLETMIYREQQSFNALGTPLGAKVCHRAFSDIEVAQGNHSAARSNGPLNICPTLQLAISHFPIRDFASFERKIALGGAAYARNTELDPSIGDTWRWLYSLWCEGNLRSWYEQQLLTPSILSKALAEGGVVRNDLVLRTLRSRGLR